jgi:hypothetical protein
MCHLITSARGVRANAGRANVADSHVRELIGGEGSGDVRR